ncbi:hypothetical protein V2J09_009815 [Rumex salicifolius]
MKRVLVAAVSPPHTATLTSGNPHDRPSNALLPTSLLPPPPWHTVREVADDREDQDEAHRCRQFSPTSHPRLYE